MIDPEFAIQRPFIIKSGFPATYLESNCVNAYVGEWVVFQLEIAENEYAELRIPFEAGIDAGLINATNVEEYMRVDHD